MASGPLVAPWLAPLKRPSVIRPTLSPAQVIAAVGFSIEGVVESPIKGPEGNIEYIVKAIYRKGEPGA